MLYLFSSFLKTLEQITAKTNIQYYKKLVNGKTKKLFSFLPKVKRSFKLTMIFTYTSILYLYLRNNFSLFSFSSLLMAINEFYYILSEHSCYYKISNRKGEYIMVNLARDFFNTLANNKLLYRGAKKWGSHFGVDQFIGGVDINGVMDRVKELNCLGISATVDHLGEIDYKKSDSIKAKNEILQVIERIHAENVDCHLSVKLTQLGSDIDETFCIQNMREILDAAASYDIFINIDMEDYLHYDQTLDILDVLRKEYNNVGTVIQSYLYRSDADIDRYQNTRLRIVKGAYKESADVAYQNQEQIDREFIELAK